MHNPQLPNREAAARIEQLIADKRAEPCSFGGQREAEALAMEQGRDAILALIPSPEQGEATAKPDAGVERLIAEWERLEKTWHDALPQVQGDGGDGGEAGRAMCQFLYEHSEELRAALATPPVDSAKPGEGERCGSIISDVMAEMLAVATASLNDDEDIMDEWPIDCRADVDRWQSVIRSALSANGEPIPMLLWCPTCHQQHIDEPDERTPDWSNPPHRSHLCHGCGCIWRPADVPTEGVREIRSTGKADTWPALSASLPEPQLGVERADVQVVPLVPTEAQWGGLARAIMMWLDMSPKTPRALFNHLRCTGEVVPDWLRDEPEMKHLDHVPSKGTRCAIIYRAMVEAYSSALTVTSKEGV